MLGNPAMAFRKAVVSLRSLYIIAACATGLVLYGAPQYRKAPLLKSGVTVSRHFDDTTEKEKAPDHITASSQDASESPPTSHHASPPSATSPIDLLKASPSKSSLNQKCYEIDPNKTQRIVIIGAGPTSLGAAHRLYELGIMRSKTQVIILEQEAEPGGLASSYRDSHRFLWDNGGHVVFSHYPYFDKVLDEAVSEWNNFTRAAYAFMMGSSGKRRFIPYPVQHNIHVMDKDDQRKSLEGLQKLADHPYNTSSQNFDNWLLNNFGPGLCEVFMRKYNHKVWTVNPAEMSSVWVEGSVAVPDVSENKAKIAALEVEGREEAEDSKWGFNQVFRFPRYGGTGGIWKRIASHVPQGWFHFHQEVKTVDAERKTLQVQADQNPNNTYLLQYDYLISTVPLHLLVTMVNESDSNLVSMKDMAAKFIYSHTHVIGIGLKGQSPEILSRKSWMYFPDSDSPFYRVTVFSKYADDNIPEPGQVWSLMCEAAEPKVGSDPTYWTKDNLINETITALVNYGFISSDLVVSKYHRRLEHGYPVPFIEREELLEIIQPWLQTRNMYSRGRFGGWRYEVSSQDHSFMQGVEVVDKIMLGIPEETYPHPKLVNSLKSSNRSLQDKLKVVPEYELVIARYDESLKWLKPFADHCHIYDKGGNTVPDFTFYQWESLPNVGRESHTYLYHIINNYDRLAEWTVFLQADFGTKQHSDEILQGHIRESRQKPWYTHLYFRTKHQWGRIKHFGKYLVELKSGEMQRANQTLGEFWQRVFGSSHPKKATSSFGGCFGLTKEHIHRHPRQFYERIIKYVNDHPNPENGHYFERLWPAIFGTD